MSQNRNSDSVAPLQAHQLNKITQAVEGLSRDELVWASGFIAGLAHTQVSQDDQSGGDSADNSAVTVLYGSQTGNAKHAAQGFSEKLAANGLAVKLVSMSDYKPRKLKDERFLVTFVSTHGEGDAPDDAVELHEFLVSKKAPKLPHMQYAIVALGDSSYEFFCQTGKDFDKRYSDLGAKSLIDRLDCDVEFEQELAHWSDSLTVKLKALFNTSSAPLVDNTKIHENSVETAVYSKKNPFTASLIESLKITGRDSVKDIRHIEISLEGSGLAYKPGDALAVYFNNDTKVVERILNATSLTSEASVEINGETYTLFDALSEKLELTLSYPGFVKAYQQASKDAALAAVMEDRPGLRTFLEERQIVDIVEQFPAKINAQALVDALRPLTPRLYSIASSQAEVEDEVHLTVAHVAYDAFGYEHQGGASGFLSTRLNAGDKLKVYVENNDNFRLPKDDNAPLIMVGPGTGIAPFRAFMQEREDREAEGKNWLFFGNPNFTQDFLYQTEWQGYLKSGLLDKVSLAFSRDQANKIYVQDRLLENGEEVFEWLEQGAHFYICGDALKMAKDVEKTLLDIIQKFGNKNPAEAKQYLLAMRKSKRYQKDVY